MGRPTQSHAATRKRKNQSLKRRIHPPILRSARQSPPLVEKNGGSLATPSEGSPPNLSGFVERCRRPSPKSYSVEASRAFNTVSQSYAMETTNAAASTNAPCGVVCTSQTQHCGTSSTQDQHPSLHSVTTPRFSKTDSQSTSTREIATSPPRSPDLRQTPRDVNTTRTDYLRALTSIVLNHSAAKMSAQSSPKSPESSKRRAVYNYYKARTMVPRYLQRRTSPFQGPRVVRPSPHVVMNDTHAKVKDMLHCDKRGGVTEPISRKPSSSSENSKATEQSSREYKTPPVLVQCSGEMVSRNFELMKERPHLPTSEKPEISRQIYTKYEADSPNNQNDLPPILVQCNGETIEQRYVQTQTVSSLLNVNENVESSKSYKSEDKAPSIKRKRHRKTAIAKTGFPKPISVLSKKRMRRPESRRIFKAISRNAERPCASSASTTSRHARESQSSKGTSSWREHSGDQNKKSSVKRRVTFIDEKSREVRLQGLKKRRQLKSISGNARSSKSSKNHAAENPTQVEETANHIRYTGNKVKEYFVQAENPVFSNTLPGLQSDERQCIVLPDPSHPSQGAIEYRSGLLQGQMHLSINAGTTGDPRNNLPAKRERDKLSCRTRSNKFTEGGNPITKTNFVNKSRARDHESEKISIEACRNDIKRLADATRCFLKYRRSIGVSENPMSQAVRGCNNDTWTEVNTPPPFPPEESTIPASSPAVPSNVAQRSIKILSNIRQQMQVHNSPGQPPKETIGPCATIPTNKSIDKRAAVRSLYSNPKRKRDFRKYAPMPRSTKITYVSDKRRKSMATPQEKKLSSFEAVEQWLHSSAASSQQGEASKIGMSDSQLRPSTRDMAVMATPRMMRQASRRSKGHIYICSKKQRPSFTNLTLKKTKCKKAAQAKENTDPNFLRHKSIDAHARCLKMLENSSSLMKAELANMTVPINDRNRSTSSNRKISNITSTDHVLQKVLQEHTSSSFIPTHGTLVYNMRPSQMIDTSQQLTANMKLKGNSGVSNYAKMRFPSTVPKFTCDKAFTQMPVKGPDVKAVPLQGTYKIVERNEGNGVACPVNVQITKGDRTRPPDVAAQTCTNTLHSPTTTDFHEPNSTKNEDVGKQMYKGHEETERKPCGHVKKTRRHGISFLPKTRISAICGKRHGGMPRRFHGPQRTGSSTKATSLSQIEQCSASSESHSLKQLSNATSPKDIKSGELRRSNTESALTNQISSIEKEKISATTEKLSYITRWSSTPRRGSHSSVSSRKTELSPYSDVSGSTFSDSGKSNNCIPTRVSSVANPQGQETVTQMPPRDVPHLVVQCTGGTISPYPLETCSLSNMKPKLAEGKDVAKQGENPPTKRPPHMVVSISWGGSRCSLQCQKGPFSETTQVLTLLPNATCNKVGTKTNTMEMSANVDQHIPTENDTQRRLKHRTTSRWADASNGKRKLARPTSRSRTPKIKQRISMPTVPSGACPRGNTRVNSPAAYAKSIDQSKKDKAAIEVNNSDSTPPFPLRGLKQRSRPTLSGPRVQKKSSSPAQKGSSPIRKNVPLPRTVVPNHSPGTRNNGERTINKRMASVQKLETADSSVQVSRQGSATTSSRKESSSLGNDKHDRKTLGSQEKCTATSPELLPKLVEACVQTSADIPVSTLQSITGTGKYIQIKTCPILNKQSVSVSAQTSGICFPEKADASFQTSISTMLVPPKLPTNLVSQERWNSDFFKQTQRYLSNVASVLASQRMKAVSRTSEVESPRKPDPLAEVDVILPERKRRETIGQEHRQESTSSSSSSRATSTADASIQTNKSSGKSTPKTSSVLIEDSLRDAANLLPSHRSPSAPQPLVADKTYAIMMEESGMGGPPPWPVRTGPHFLRERGTVSAVVTSDTSSSSIILPSESGPTPKRLSGKENSCKSDALDASKDHISLEKIKKSASPLLKRRTDTSHRITSAVQNSYGYQRRAGSSSVLVRRVDKVFVPHSRKGNSGNVTSPKKPFINSSRSPVTSPRKGYINKIHAFGDPSGVNPPLPPPRKLTYPSLIESRPSNICGHSSKSSNSMPRKLVQILQSQNPSGPKPTVIRRSKNVSKVPNRKSQDGSVQPAKQSAPPMGTSAGRSNSPIGSRNTRAPQKGAEPPPGNKEGEPGAQPSKAPKGQDAKANAAQGSTPGHLFQRSQNTGATTPRVQQTPGSLLVVMPRVTESPPQLRPRPSGV